MSNEKRKEEVVWLASESLPAGWKMRNPPGRFLILYSLYSIFFIFWRNPPGRLLPTFFHFPHFASTFFSEKKFFLSPAGQQFACRRLALKFVVDNRFPESVVFQLRKSMEEDGWKTSQHLPLNWIYKVIITSSKNYSVNINILSDLAEKFESYLAAIKYLESSPRYGEAEVAGINLLLADNTRDWRRTVFNPIAATDNPLPSLQVALPEGWKTRQCGSRKYTVSPSGEQFPTRKKALQHMIQSEYSEEKDIDTMRLSMLTEGWKTTDYLPRHWLYKTGDGEGRKDVITILAETGEQFNSYLAAIKYMESSLEFDEEDVRKVNELLAEVKGGGMVPAKDQSESSLLPPGWRNRTLGRQTFVVSPEGEQFTNKRKALQAMVRLGAGEGSMGLMRKAMVEEDGWKRSLHLPKHWLFKYSHQDKSTRVDIITHCGDILNSQH